MRTSNLISAGATLSEGCCEFFLAVERVIDGRQQTRRSARSPITDIKSCSRYVISDWDTDGPVQCTTLSSVSSKRIIKFLDPLNV